MRATARLRGPGSAVCGLLLALGLAGWAASPAWADGGGGGGGGGGYSPGGSRSSREQKAQEKFEAGERHRERGIELESRAAAAGDEAGRLRGEARAEFERALREYEGAVRANRDLIRAHNGIGFTRRKLGDYEGALEAYDRALELNPRFAPAIEYRGEAYLELGRLDDAKGAYLQLFASERELADLLMGKMQSWVERRRRDLGSLAPGQIDDFARWVEERAEIARQTARLPAQGGASW